MYKTKGEKVEGITVYSENIDDYLAESYYLLNSHAHFIRGKYAKYNSLASHNRSAFFNKLSTGFQQNLRNVEGILDSIKTHIDIDSFSKIKIASKHEANNLILKDFIYLRRDWSFSPECEDQLHKIETFVMKELEDFSFERDSCLFLGCGSGRLAIDFIDGFNKVLATDKSFSMIWHLNELIEGRSVTFYIPKISNIQSIQNAAQKYEVSIPNKILKKISSENFNYFISDVLDLPIENHSLNAIFSIYFSDVVALRLWFHEIDKVLKENGIFLHFGPLDYFFTDEREMLTAEEFRAFFEENGYCTLIDKTLDLPHLRDKNSNTYKVYRNWFFVAQKKSTLSNAKRNLDDQSVLKINKPVKFEKIGQIYNGIEELEVNINLPRGKFEGAESVIEILSKIDGNRNYLEIKNALLEDEYDIDNNSLLKVIEFLLSEGILSIKFDSE